MGKKVKKDDKAPPEDVFDPLLVESRQAATVVLMLSSPEDEVLAKACEAIYKFVEKCDENKKTLIDLDAHDPLLRLVLHEEKTVRRNAVMALGVLAAHPDARKLLKKREETIPSMVQLLAPEEDSVVHEFAALCLSYLAQDFSSKVHIFENDGLEPLIRCLSSSDPDVQKNAVETINLMLMDYQSKSGIRELNGFPPLLELLNSQYPVIQHLALCALERATHEVENRTVLRELEAVNKIIDFIGKPEQNDLHVFAVMVLSNCLEDTETMEAIKENGGLPKLIAFITDTKPPEDEEPKKGGGKGGKEKGGSRAGKKGKGDDVKSARSTPTNDKKKGGEADPVIPTLPEVKEHAARAIARAAKNGENRKILHEQEIEKLLIFLLNHEDPNVQVSGAQALGVMSQNLLSRESIGHWEGIEPLIKMLKSDHADVREASSMALANLTSSNLNNCHEVVKFGGIDALIQLLSDTREMAISNAAITLTNMSPEESTRSDIINCGIVAALVPPLSSPNTLVQEKCALAVAAFVTDGDARSNFRECGGVAPLVALLTSGNDDVRRAGSWAVNVIAADEQTAIEISRHGGLDVLQELQLSTTRKNAFTDVALAKLLDSNLSAKYALTGRLLQSNHIRDGFFDAGSQRPGTKFQSLEDVYKMPVNQKRPVLLVNAKQEKPQTPAPLSTSEIEVAEKSSKSSVSGRNSRTGRDKTSKSRAAKEKEEKQKEEEAVKESEGSAAVAGEPAPFTPPGDNNLVQYIEEVHDKIMPLPTTRDQVIGLAQYVADKMGGPIDRGQVTNFSWELPLSQLKFDLKSNVIPIGLVKAGIHYHRALLFKALADRIAVGASLIRGEYNRAWNEVLIAEEAEPGSPQFPPKRYIVDLIHQPGRLMLSDSPDAVNYQKL